jgi:WD40 repeat protein
VRHISLDGGALLEPPDHTGVATILPEGAPNAGDLLTVGADGVVSVTAPRRAWALERVIGDAEDPALLADRVMALAFSPDGKILATGGGVPSREGELKLWRVADGGLVLNVPKAHGDSINALAFSPDGDSLATASSDRLARVWKSGDGSRLASLEGHTGHVLGVAWRPDGLALATGGADRTVRRWDLATRKAGKKTDTGGEVNGLVYAGADDLIFAVAGGQPLLGEQSLPQSQSVLFCAASDASGKLVAGGGSDGLVRVWTVADRKVLRTFSPGRP